jgi:hypothetical protein
MVRASIAILALTAIVFAVLFSGCAGDRTVLPLDMNNTTPAYGYVYFESKAAAGANVEAVSVDGILRVTNITNNSGAYVLNLKPEVWYRVTATYRGMKHTIWPVYLSRDGHGNSGYDINLTQVSRSMIAGAPMAGSNWTGSGIYITAVPSNGDAPLTAVTGDDGSYAIDVAPDIYYIVSGDSYDFRGMQYPVSVFYRNTIGCTKVKPGKDETVLLDYQARIDTTPSLVVNGTVGIGKINASLPGRISSAALDASGHVYLDGNVVKGARVEAVSQDGSDHVSGVTDAGGVYVLNLEPKVPYSIIASYQGLRHTIRPVFLYSAAYNLDINLTKSPTSSIEGNDQRDLSYSTSNVMIAATPADGGPAVVTLTDENGGYVLDLKPGVRYAMSGRYYDAYGQTISVDFMYRDWTQCADVTVGPDETVLLDAVLFLFHPPMGFSMARDPVTGVYGYFLPAPVSIEGDVYLDGKPAQGASMEAVSAGGGQQISTVTDKNGAYKLEILSGYQFNVTAFYQGLQHTVWPVHLYNNMTGVYDIYMTRTPGSTITGIPAPDQEELARAGNIITAVPVAGGEPLTAVTAGDGSYSLDVEPLVYYDISGKSQDANGQYYKISFFYRTGISTSGFMIHPNETALIDYHI